MIFVTVGNMDPFDRLVRAVDEWDGLRHCPVEMLVQIGHGMYRPRNCRYVAFLSPDAFRRTFAQARLVVSHAGMGTIITALEFSKPLLVMPKRADLGEQRNEHQLATVSRFRRSDQIHIAASEAELHQLLNELLAADQEKGPAASSMREWRPDQSLIEFVRSFVTHR